MLYNSQEFIFAFFPITLIAFFLIGRRSRAAALRWLIMASVFFYAWWQPSNVLLIAPSILFNFGIARALQGISRDKRSGLAKTVLAVGIAFNIAFLGYFKYAGFFAGAMNDIFGTDLVVAKILLPLGISFITFQKIAFLIDVSAGRVAAFTFEDYCLFVLFFPQLIVGPIVHYREVMPQFQRATCRYDRENVAVGLTLFAFGLCKKTFLADGIAPLVTDIFRQASIGQSITLFPAWMAAIGFTLQIYFDFSGYSDMAIGVARCFGIRLPPNFNSPLRATSIIEFWLRWHMTLSRFLTAYIFNPLSLWLTRRRMERGLKGVGGHSTSVRAFLTVVMFPTMLTMSISGLWHGAGYVFVFWGVLHGFFLTINHAWLLIARPFRRHASLYRRIMRPVGFALTFTGVVGAMVFFRSSSMGIGWNIIGGMLGRHGASLPSSLVAHMGPLMRELSTLHVGVGPPDGSVAKLAGWLVGLCLIAWFAPNTLQIMARFEPALGFNPAVAYKLGPSLTLAWNVSWVWTGAVAVTAIVAILHLRGLSEFLYWHF